MSIAIIHPLKREDYKALSVFVYFYITVFSKVVKIYAILFSPFPLRIPHQSCQKFCVSLVLWDQQLHNLQTVYFYWVPLSKVFFCFPELQGNG